jgi:hypothetical protein
MREMDDEERPNVGCSTTKGLLHSPDRARALDGHGQSCGEERSRASWLFVEIWRQAPVPTMLGLGLGSCFC